MGPIQFKGKKKKKKNLYRMDLIHKIVKTCKIQGGEYFNYFLTEWAARGLKPLPN